MKHGAYVEVQQTLSSHVMLLGRVDGMARFGNVAADSPLHDGSTVTRFTVGPLITIDRGMRVKLSSELWDFSDANARGQERAVSVHAALVGAF